MLVFSIIFHSQNICLAKNYVNLSKIKMIESSGNPNAYNEKTEAIGLYQITPVCLKEWNNYHPKEHYTKNDLYNPEINEKIAKWYLNIRIPEMLKYYGYKITVENIIICYDWGIGNFIKWKKGKKKLPEETKNYLREYGND